MRNSVRTTTIKKILFCCLALLPTLGFSEIYKCKNASGIISFSDRPCQSSFNNTHSIEKKLTPNHKPTDNNANHPDIINRNKAKILKINYAPKKITE